MIVAELAAREDGSPYFMDPERRDFMRETALRIYLTLRYHSAGHALGLNTTQCADQAWQDARVLWNCRGIDQ